MRTQRERWHQNKSALAGERATTSLLLLLAGAAHVAPAVLLAVPADERALVGAGLFEDDRAHLLALLINDHGSDVDGVERQVDHHPLRFRNGIVPGLGAESVNDEDDVILLGA